MHHHSVKSSEHNEFNDANNAQFLINNTTGEITINVNCKFYFEGIKSNFTFNSSSISIILFSLSLFLDKQKVDAMLPKFGQRKYFRRQRS